MNEKNKLNIEDMKDVNGGSIWVSEDRAKAIGVELRNEDGTPGEFGYLWNSGDYYFNGQKLDQSDVARLLDYYDMTGKAASSLEEAMEYIHKRMADTF